MSRRHLSIILMYKEQLQSKSSDSNRHIMPKHICEEEFHGMCAGIYKSSNF